MKENKIFYYDQPTQFFFQHTTLNRHIFDFGLTIKGDMSFLNILVVILSDTQYSNVAVCVL